MPKNRSTIFVVVRESDLGDLPIEGYLTLERAEEVASKHQKDFHDRGFVEFDFVVKPISYYEE